MKNTFLFVAGALVLFLIGLLVGQSTDPFGGKGKGSYKKTPVVEKMPTSDAHSHHAEESMGHQHDEVIAVPVESAPTVTLKVEKDVISGWNVQLTTTNFVFSPENASAQHVVGQGHAHLYVSEQKIARLYGEWFHLHSLPTGQHVVRVSLHANSHEAYAIDGEVVSDEVVIVVE